MYRLTMRNDQGEIMLSLLGSKEALQDHAKYLKTYNKYAQVKYRIRITEVKKKGRGD